MKTEKSVPGKNVLETMPQEIISLFWNLSKFDYPLLASASSSLNMSFSTYIRNALESFENPNFDNWEETCHALLITNTNNLPIEELRATLEEKVESTLLGSNTDTDTDTDTDIDININDLWPFICYAVSNR